MDKVMFLRLEGIPARLRTMEEPMARVDLRRVQRAAQRLQSSRQEFESAIRAASASGETYRDIAAAAGISHQRVGQIVKAGKV